MNSPATHARRHPAATPRPTRRLAAGTALAAVTALVLSGCMKMDMELTLSEEDTATGTAVMAFSDEFAESLGMEPGELWDMMEEGEDSVTGDLPPGATEEPFADGEYTGVKVTYADEPIDTLTGAGGPDDLSITREGDEYVVQGTMDLSDTGEEEGELPPELMEGFVFRFAVTFPGEVSETTGTVDGTTVEWNPAMGEVTDIYARASAVAGGTGTGTGTDDATDDTATATESPATEDGAASDTDVEEAAAEDVDGFPWWIVGLVLGLAVLGVVTVLVVRNNRRPEPAAAPQGDAFGMLPGQQAPGTGTGTGTAPDGQNPPAQQPGQPPVDPYGPDPR